MAPTVYMRELHARIKRNMKRRWLTALAAGLLTNYAVSVHGFERFVVKEIRIEGLQRITEGTVYNYLPVTVGESLAPEKTGEILKALFETGFFQDIELKRDGNVLVVQVIERPTIGKITVTGNKEVTEENLLSTLKTAGLSEGYVFDRSMLEQVRNELERLYFSHGKYAVKVDTTVENQPHNRVSVSITIDEGQAARIKAINLVGNYAFSTSELLKSFTLSPTNYASWISQADQYDKQKLSADLEALRTFYLDRGYLNFRIISTQVAITPDKQDIYINVNIEEGNEFRLSGFQLAGNTILPESELLPLVDLKDDEVFSRAKVAGVVKKLTDRLGQEGYAFAKINPVPDIQDEERTVRLTFYVEPGNKIYVRKVMFEGNSKTKDEVIRREIIQMESAPVNTKFIEDSKARLNRTGYFTNVSVETRPVSGTTDEVDIVFTVEEASSGQLGGGVGYSDVDGLLFNANVSNRNFLGTGKSVDFNFNRSKAYTTYNLAYNNPYYTIDGISRGFNVFYSETDLGKATSITNYTTDAYGANMSYGMPISPHDRLTFGYGFQSTSLSVGQIQVPTEILAFVAENGTKSNEVTVAFGWIHNTFDRMVFPEKGLQQAAGATFSVPGSHLEYYRLSYSAQNYQPLTHGFIAMTTGTLGYGNGYGKNDTLPFYKNYFAGGSRTVRGFEESSLGPTDSLGNPFGGNFLVTATAALIIPNFFIDTKAIRVAWFLDGGQVYDLENRQSTTNPNESRNPSGLRYSTGLSLTWMSPIAPLVFSLATPLNEHEGDRIQNFAFTFGTVF